MFSVDVFDVRWNRDQLAYRPIRVLPVPGIKGIEALVDT